MAPKASSSKSSKAATPSSSAPTKAPKPPKDFLTRPSKSSLKHSSKIYFHPEVLKPLNLSSGDLIRVSKSSTVGEGVVGLVGVNDGKNDSMNVVEISKCLRQLGGFYLGDRAVVEKVARQLDYAKNVVVRLKLRGNKRSLNNDDLSEKFKVKLQKFLGEVGVLMPGMSFSKFELVDDSGNVIGEVDIKVVDIDVTMEDVLSCNRSNDNSNLPDISKLSIQEDSGEDSDDEFEIFESSSSNNDRLVSSAFLYDRSKSAIEIFTENSELESTSRYLYSKYPSIPQLPKLSTLGGLSHQASTIKYLAKLTLQKPEIFSHFNIKPSRGVLLYGPSGTGKTTILNCLANEFFHSVHVVRIDGSAIISKYLGDAETKLKELFNEARLHQPSIILMDEIDSLVPARNAGAGGEDTDMNDTRILASLLSLLDGLENSCRVVVVAATTSVNSVDLALRRPGRFDKEIEVGIPDVDARSEILHKMFESMGKDGNGLTAEDIEKIASVSHGYVGADLVALIREAIMVAIGKGNNKVMMDDINVALNEIRPSAMKEIFLEMPKVYWSDIGGQDELKRKLKEMVQMPLEAADTFKRLGVDAPKGVLLYGPPGCSKTLTAKALATESGLNFLAVKGPEIFNKYVGESEKAIREIFRKARAASPSIIFFDEIDAISGDRMLGEGGNSSGSGSNVLTTLLNEIDGVEELNGVIIVGATNKPAAIDPALMRPGRLDRHIYVGPPDYQGRLKILQMRTRQFGISNEYLEKMAKRLEGCSGAEVVLVCQEAGINAIMEDNDADRVNQEHFEVVVQGLKRGITEEMLEYYRGFSSGEQQ
ncbi:AAA family ATPase [Saccharomycopsis crataegensis]|uniref:AAA family ATPase n=1 Tax=Saccharomycopsis crataegensis TaxID=43959 RepID=A0AAV5QN37_9ASCO|nr:AAA family ATPase [Saccharomycopsis crataegensis]